MHKKSNTYNILTRAITLYTQLINAKKKLLLTLILSSISIPIKALEPITITDSLKSINCNKNIEYLEDKDGKLTFEKISTENFSWKKSESTKLNFGFTNSAYWFRFIVINKQVQQNSWYLVIDYPLIDYIELYQEDGTGIWSIRKAGDHYPFHERDIKDRKFIFKIKKVKEKNMFLMRIKTSSSYNFNISAMSLEEYIHQVKNEFPIIWIFYGLMLIMALYNLFLSISTRSEKYLYYSFFIIFIILFEFTLNGFSFQYLWPNSIWWANNSIPFFICTALSWGYIFIYIHINLKKKFPLIGKIFMYATIIPCVTWAIISLFLKYRISIIGATALTIATALIAFFSVLYTMIKNDRASRYIVIGFIYLVFGMILYGLKSFGIIQSTFITDWSLYLGSALVVLLLSLSLADEINLIRNQLVELNINLEKKVKERTFQLKERTDELEKELDLAQKIQEELIPQESPWDFISSLYKPMKQIGGDFYDFLEFRDSDNIGIFISDVSGHGVPAAFITSMIKTIILQSGTRKQDPSELLQYMNNILQKHTAGNFVTAFYGIYNPSDRTLLYSNAGHNQPYLIHEDISELQGGKNTAMAMFSKNMLERSNKVFENYTDKLPVGSKLLLYTDGLTETRPMYGEAFFEYARMLDVFQKNKNLPCGNFVIELYKELVAFRQSETFDDDISLVCLDVI